MRTVKLYVEGGGDSGALHSRCREGFSKFLERAGFKGRMPRIIAGGGRGKTYDLFKTACTNGESAFLLLDSEDAISNKSPWEHLANRRGDEYVTPLNATDEHCHFMVVCMESWFLADKGMLSQFFGQGFNVNALPKNTDIETIPKADVYAGLQRSTANCKTKAPYGKGEHSFKLLAMIDPDKVKDASPWAKRFIEILDAHMRRAS